MSNSKTRGFANFHRRWHSPIWLMHKSRRGVCISLINTQQKIFLFEKSKQTVQDCVRLTSWGHRVINKSADEFASRVMIANKQVATCPFFRAYNYCVIQEGFKSNWYARLMPLMVPCCRTHSSANLVCPWTWPFITAPDIFMQNHEPLNGKYLNWDPQEPENDAVRLNYFRHSFTGRFARFPGPRKWFTISRAKFFHTSKR